MTKNTRVYINKNNDEGSDALFWAAYLVDDDTDVAPLILQDGKQEVKQDATKQSEDSKK